MSIQSSINQMLGNVGLLANTFQFQNQIKKTEEISSQVAQLNEQKAKLEADKAKFQTDSDKERAKLKKDRSDFDNYVDISMRDIKEAWEGVTPYQPGQEYPEVDLWGLNPYAAGNAMASNNAQQRVDAERQRKNQYEALKKAFENIGMGGGNDNG